METSWENGDKLLKIRRTKDRKRRKREGRSGRKVEIKPKLSGMCLSKRTENYEKNKKSKEKKRKRTWVKKCNVENGKGLESSNKIGNELKVLRKIGNYWKLQKIKLKRTGKWMNEGRRWKRNKGNRKGLERFKDGWKPEESSMKKNWLEPCKGSTDID